MKGLVPAAACGILLSGALYGLLAGVRREPPLPQDPWLAAWEEAGERPELLDFDRSPETDLLFREGRRQFDLPEAPGSVVRRYLFERSVPAQVVLLASSESAPAFPEGRHLRFRLREGGEAVHLLRSGRRMLLVPVSYSLSMFGRETTDPELVERLFDVFERTAAELP